MQLLTTTGCVGLVLINLVSAFPAALEERGSCNGDNCLRFIRKDGRDPILASSYCQKFLSSTPGTVTILASETSYTTPSQPTITVAVEGSTITTTLGKDCTVTTTAAPIFAKRAETTPFDIQALSACPSANKVAQLVRISSACNCWLTSATVTVTNTINSILPTPQAATETVSSVVTVTAATTTCNAIVTATVTPTCKQPPAPKCNLSKNIGCNHILAAGGSDNGCGCYGRVNGCSDGATYCVSSAGDKLCKYDSDCEESQYCMSMDGPYRRPVCGFAGTPGVGAAWCVARSLAVRRDLEWAAVVDEVVGADEIALKAY